MTEMQAKDDRARISAIIACYKDGQAIPIMYRRLVDTFQKINVRYEIIFVNDHSPDDSREVLKTLADGDPNVIAIHHSRNFGSQNAFTSGMRISTGDAVVLLDGDLQDPPELIADFYQKWREGYKVVYGERVRRETSFFMQAAYKAFYRAFHSLSYIPVPVDAGDFSLLDRQVVDVLNALPEKNRFLRGLRAWAGFSQVGVPYLRPERMFGKSTNNLLRNLEWARKAILSFSYKPLDLITVLAGVTVLASLLGILWQIFYHLAFPKDTPSGFTTIILLILFLGGIQLICLAIIGSYLAHIYDEVKSRPTHIVEGYFNYPRPQEPPR